MGINIRKNESFFLFVFYGIPILFLFSIPFIVLQCDSGQMTAAAPAPKDIKKMDLKAEFKLDAIHAEGRSNKVYLLDGILHVGIGHKLVGPELNVLELGDTVSDETIDALFEKDYQTTKEAANKWFPEFDDYPNLAQLAILNWLYQLGPSSPKKFPKATEALRNREWRVAADNWLYASVETMRYSKWHRETPVRCNQEVHRLQAVWTAEFLEKQKEEK